MSTRHDPSGAIPAWTLGWRLKRALAWADISVQDMADELGYSRSQLSRWMNDKGENPRRTVIAQWAMRCGVPFEWLAYGIESGDPDGADSLPLVKAGGTSDQESAVSRCTVLHLRAA